jgi:ring-1,2-phenylacetyl-CoA epoxidase subunit PaaE
MLEKKYPERFECIRIFSNPTENGSAIYGHLNLAMLKELVISYSRYKPTDSAFFTCGPFPYMRMVNMILIAMGYEKEQIRKENFDVPKTGIQLWGLPVKDKLNKRIRIYRNGEMTAFEAGFSESILDAALRQGIKLPYSCRGGICSTCTARCTEGQVWMSVNDVLTDKELNEGFVLTCTGYAVSSEVKIEYR